MSHIHERAYITCKLLTRKLAESAAPVLVVVNKLKEVNKENIKLLLTRCEKLYQLQEDVTSILTLFVKLENGFLKENQKA